LSLIVVFKTADKSMEHLSCLGIVRRTGPRCALGDTRQEQRGEEFRFTLFIGRIDGSLEQQTDRVGTQIGKQVHRNGNVLEGDRIMLADDVAEFMEDDVKTVKRTGVFLEENVIGRGGRYPYAIGSNRRDDRTQTQRSMTSSG